MGFELVCFNLGYLNSKDIVTFSTIVQVSKPLRLVVGKVQISKMVMSKIHSLRGTSDFLRFLLMQYLETMTNRELCSKIMLSK